MVGQAPLSRDRCVLLADDLTGACDVGAAARRRGWRVRCVLASAPAWRRAARPRRGEAVVIDLETRRLAQPAAVRRTSQVIRWLSRRKLVPAYFKIDSTLRGHPVAEAAAARGDRRIWFVPANPRMGRTVVGGRLFVRGIPVERTAFSRDPLHPVRSGDLRRLTRSLGVRGGCAVPDVRSDRDLRRIAHAMAPGDLAVGAAALADYVIPAFREPRRGRSETVGRSNDRVLAVIGSMHPVSAVQVRRAGGSMVRRLGPAGLRRPLAASFGGARGLSILALDPAGFRGALGTTPDRRRVAGERVARAFARIAARVIRRWRPETLMLSGGLTAAAVCEALRVSSLTLLRESAPGVVLSDAVWPGGRARVLTKPGGFGGADVLRRLARA